MMIDNEYKHPIDSCACLKGYRNLHIRGYDMKDVYPQGGDVIACWHDPSVIGNIKEDWYLPNFRIIKRHNRVIEVIGVPKTYRGTNKKDVYNPKELDI
jgi:hypothetical protein